ncbi:hypothetical protein [Sporosarcina ureae]|uniref:hypothetical protein n=1 Tax=Sporosarcina ureae TaxID=1571 RepID=UPI0028A9396B|nr:hypothetical protein [Sporosarcina ureae]
MKVKTIYVTTTSKRKLDDISSIVVTTLYRRIIEWSEGVCISGVHGLLGPALLNFRGQLEAYLAFTYILQGDSLLEDRSKA